MATVRITKELTEAVQGAARSKFTQRIRDAENSYPNTWGDYIYEKVFGQYASAMEALPKEFFNWEDEIRVNKIGDITCNLRFELTNKRPWPMRLPPDAPAETSYSGYLALTHDLVWGELYAEVMTWKTKCATIRKQAEEFVEGVSAVLSAHSTLAPAIKAWPPLWELLPEYTKNKHKEITERRRADKSAVDTDVLNKLTAVVAASKLGGL